MEKQINEHSTIKPEEHRTPFPRVFWVANSIEVLERFAYYGIYTGFGIYMQSLGYSRGELGIVQSLFLTLSYMVPLISGTFADRFGFKKVLIVSYLAYLPSILLLILTKSFSGIALTMLSIGLAAGTFKPLIAGTVRVTTDPTNKTLGFGIFYAMVNIGGSFGPIVAGKLRAIDWNYAFMVNAMAICLMLLVTLFFYKEPPRATQTETLGQKFRGIGTALSDLRFSAFLLLLGIFFWWPFWAFSNVCAVYVESNLNTSRLYLDLRSVFGAGFASLFSSPDDDGVHKPGSLFGIHDFADFSALAAYVQQPTKPVDQWLSEQLSTSTKVALFKMPNTSAEAKELKRALTNDFNRIIRGPSIYEEQRFLGITLRSETSALRAQNPQGQDLARLNRLLLEDAYPLELAGNRATFSVDDYLDVPAIMDKLRQSKRPMDQWLAGQLSNLGATPEKKALMQELNRIIRGPSIFQDQLFAGVSVRKDTINLRAQNPQGDQLAWLNRSLLQDAYRLEVSANRKLSGETISHTGYIIMLLQLLISRIFERYRAMPSFRFGLVVAAAGFAVIASARTNAVSLVFLGIALFAIGEMITSPRIQEYITWIAPKEKAGLYMGSNFLAVMVGAALSGLYTSLHGYFEHHNHPEYVWYVLAGHLLLGVVVFWTFIRLAGEFGQQKA